MPKLLRWALIVVVLIGTALFAVANHDVIDIRLNPVDQGPAPLRVPLFIAIFVFFLLGVLVGGAAAWLRQAKWRRLARERGRALDGLNRELAELRAVRAAPVVVPTGSLPDTVPRGADPYI